MLAINLPISCKTWILKRTKYLYFSKNLRKKKKLKKNGFTLIELVIVILIFIILAAISIPSFLNLIEKAEVELAKRNLLEAFLECQIKIAEGETNPRYTIPPNTNKFQYPDSGTDGECLSPSSGIFDSCKNSLWEKSLDII